MSTPAGMLSFLRVVGSLKRTKRAGWVLCGVPDVESVSDHMYRMALMALAVAAERRDRVMKMALVHDLAEAIVGDITPHDGVSGEEKEKRERAALLEITAPLPPEISSEVCELWEEYEAGESEDARLVKDIDKFEMILQADEYEESTGIDLQQFIDSTEGKFRTEQVQILVKELCEQRKQRKVKETINATHEKQ